MDTSPNLHLQRPLPPASRKRSSNHASGTSSRSDSPAPRHMAEDAGNGISPDEDRTMDEHDYEAEVEKALMGLSREDLVMALGRAKTQMDNLDSRLEEQTLLWEQSRATNLELQSKLGLAEAEADSLSHAVSARDARMDELLAETERLESEVYAKLGLVDRLRAQLAESDRRAADAERQYVDQTNTAEQERKYFADLEGLLKKQKEAAATAHEKLARQNRELVKENERVRAQLSRAKGPGVPSPQGTGDSATGDESYESDIYEEPGQDGAAQDEQPKASRQRRSQRTLAEDIANDEELDSLRSELDLVQRSHASLTSTMHTLQAELRDLKASNSALRDECETYRDILQEKTFSGALLARSAVLSGYRSGGAGADDDKEDDGSDEENDEDDDRAVATDDVDDVPDAPPPAKIIDPAKENARRRRQIINKSSQQFLSAPADLASELEGAEGDAEERRRKKRKEREEQLPSDVSFLQKEVIELRDANKALTLYISKIIDRIIAREGYENVLAKDGDGIGKLSISGSAPSVRRRSSKAKLSGVPEEDAASTSRNVTSRAAKRASGLLSFGGGGALSSSPGGPVSPGERTAKPRRTASLDWRSLLGGVGGGGGPGNEENPHLRPLTLQSAATSSVSSAATSNAGPPIVSGRRLTPTEEDLQDGIERERIRAALEMQGIELPEHQLQPSTAARLGASPSASPTSASKRASGAFSSFFSRVVPGGVTAFAPGAGAVGVSAGGGGAAGAPGSPRGPRLTTFDDPTPARPQRDASPSPSARSGASGGGATAAFRTSTPIDPNSTTAPSGAGLTEYRRPIRSSRPSRGAKSATGATTGDESRTSSTAGDESYAMRGDPGGDVE